jgi:hypothetical protein
MARLQKVVDIPKHSTEIKVPDTPSNNTGFRPTRSDNRLHVNCVSICATNNKDSYQSYPIA